MKLFTYESINKITRIARFALHKPSLLSIWGSTYLTPNSLCPALSSLPALEILRFCCYSVAKSCPTLCDPTDCSTPGFPTLHHLLELAKIHIYWVRMPSHHLILCCPLLLLPSIFPSIRVFFNESALHIRRHTQVQMLKVLSLWLPFFPTSFPMGVVPHQSPWRIYSLWGNMPRSIYLQPGQRSALASGKNAKSPLKNTCFP